MQAQAPIYKCLAKLRCFNANTKEKKKKKLNEIARWENQSM